MAIDPTITETVIIPELDTAALVLTNYFAHSTTSGSLKKATINSLAIFLAPYVSSIGASGFIPVTSSTLPNPTTVTSAYSIVGAGTYTQTTGDSLILSSPLNVISWNGSTWSLAEQITIDLNLYAKKSDVFNVVRSASVNLFNKNAAKKGFYVDPDTGGLIPNAAYYYSEYIPVTGGQSYVKLEFHAWYDANNVFISGGVTPGGASFVAPSNASYLRMSVHESLIDGWQVEAGTANTPYQDFILINGSQIKKNTLAYEKLIFQQSKNLFDKDTALLGYVMNQFGTLGVPSPDPLYSVSDFILVDQQKTYVINHPSFVTFYSDRSTPLMAITVNGTAPLTFSTPPLCNYVRLSPLPYDSADQGPFSLYAFQMELGSTSTSYEPYYKFSASQGKGAVLLSSYGFVKSTNLFNKKTAVSGYYISPTTGGLVANSDYFFSDYIPVKPSTSYSSVSLHAFYDANMLFISGGAPPTPSTVTSPSNAAYIRMSPYKTQLDKWQFQEGATNTGYEPFGLLIEADRVKYDANTGTLTTQLVVKSGGTVGVDCDFTDIKTALDSIVNNSKNNPYRISVRNGVYDFSGQSYKYLGIKNYVEIVGQTRSGVKVINRKSSYDFFNAVFDAEGYSNKIEYALIQNMTLISYNGKGAVHIDTDYNHLIDGGSIHVVDCDLINENTSGMENYQVALACGLDSGQRVVCKNLNSNGILWAHNKNHRDDKRGFVFELYNCRMPWNQMYDEYNYSYDKFIMQGCSLEYIDFGLDNSLSTKRSYTEFAISALMTANNIGYIKGTDTALPGNRYAFWDSAFGGKFGINESSIHMYCKNTYGSTINRDTLVTGVINQTNVQPWSDGDFLFGQALDNIPSGEWGTVQYSGIIFVNSSGVISFNDKVTLNSSGRAVVATGTDFIGYSMSSVVSDSTIKVKIK